MLITILFLICVATKIVCEIEYPLDQFTKVPIIIRRHGYKVESHVVTTEDGYIITLIRIPGSKDGKRNNQPVLLEHGVMGDSSCFILNGRNSLGFVLADEGYDVWMANHRGTAYSKDHMSLFPSGFDYWNFSMHEIGVYDLSASILYINEVTGSTGQIIHIGHSMGSTVSFILAAERPDIAQHIKLNIAIAPGVFAGYVKSPIRFLTPYVKQFDWIRVFLGINEFLPHYEFYNKLGTDCSYDLLGIICENLFFLLFGYDENEFNSEILPSVLHHLPSGTSTKAVLHLAQGFNKKRLFRHYDYGILGNIQVYGKKQPPQYDLSKATMPVYIMYAENDIFATEKDVLMLSEYLSNVLSVHKVQRKGFSHIDFIFGKDVYELVYRPMLSVLRNYTGF